MRRKYEVIVEVDADELDTGYVMHEQHLQEAFDRAYPLASIGAIRVLSSRKIGESNGD